VRIAGYHDDTPLKATTMTNISIQLRNAALSAALVAAMGAAQAGTITTLPSTGNIGSFGNVSSGSTPTYGETFTATAALGRVNASFVR
jgi:hypothetical protein